MNILLICGGDGSEHAVSVVSAAFLKEQLTKIPNINIIDVVAHKQYWEADNKKCFINSNKELVIENESKIKIDYVIPCFHGFPGETGDIQSYFELLGIPYLGCSSESSKLCYNKISTKLWLSELGIPNTPFISLYDFSDKSKESAISSMKSWGRVFVKAACEGSSVGCYQVDHLDDLLPKIKEAFNFSDRVLIEKAVKPRELEVAAYEYNGQIVVTSPGEIVCNKNTFYTYEEKYGSSSSSKTNVIAENLTEKQVLTIKDLALRAYKGLKLKDLSRIDFFLTSDNEIYLNEINTFPGMTSTSLFPKMLENTGITMSSYLAERINKALAKL